MAADQRHGLELNYRAVPYRMCGMQATFKEGVNTPRLYSGVPRGEESMSREGDAYIIYWVRLFGNGLQSSLPEHTHFSGHFAPELRLLWRQ
jgi:hypothetical protein